MSAAYRTLITALIAVALLAPAASVAEGKKRPHKPAAARSVADCPDADLDPTADNLGRIRTAILCLHNQIRAAARPARLR